MSHNLKPAGKRRFIQISFLVQCSDRPAPISTCQNLYSLKMRLRLLIAISIVQNYSQPRSRFRWKIFVLSYISHNIVLNQIVQSYRGLLGVNRIDRLRAFWNIRENEFEIHSTLTL